MRLSAMVAFALWSQGAWAAEVVWLGEPTVEQAARVAAAAHSTGDPLTVAAFRGLTTAPTVDDALALEALAQTLVEVRKHEAVLDGELAILQGIEPALAKVTLMRNLEERAVVFHALAYEGFAVDRYFGDELVSAPEAAPYRIIIDDQAVERPWLDAFALDPLRKPTAEDIGEKPSRVAYDALRRSMARALRANLLVPDLPAGAEVFVDGEPQEMGVATVLELLPGRHFVHVQLGEHIVAREALRLDPGARHEVQVALTDEVWRDLVLDLKRSVYGKPSSALQPFLQALDGEFWIADAESSVLRAWRISAAGAALVELPEAPRVETVKEHDRGGAFARVSASAWAGLAFVHGGDYRVSDGFSSGPWNTAAPQLGAGLAWDRGWLRYGVGLGMTVPLGAEQVASVEERDQRVRVHPHVLVGHPLAQFTLGYVFPHHPTAGVQVVIPVQGVEVRGRVQVGVPPAVQRQDGSVWRGEPWTTLGVAVAYRLRP